jgi:hypothetical protein
MSVNLSASFVCLLVIKLYNFLTVSLFVIFSVCRPVKHFDLLPIGPVCMSPVGCQSVYLFYLLPVTFFHSY